MRIAVLISGGVDSAVAVHRICEMGYKPDLFYIKIGMEGESGRDVQQAYQIRML